MLINLYKIKNIIFIINKNKNKIKNKLFVVSFKLN